MTPNAAPTTTTSYALSSTSTAPASPGVVAALRRLVPLMHPERRSIAIACVAVVISSVLGLLGPLIIAHTIDRFISRGDFSGVLTFGGLLLATYIVSFVTTYVQTQTMGSVGRRVLFTLRNTLFTKLQELPLEFFNQNKAGDLISRINNDTDKLNQFFAQSLVQLAANVVMMFGAAVFVVTLDLRLGVAALVPALVVFVLTRISGAWIKRANVRSLQSLGGLSAEVQESLSNFKVVVAFNRRDYFRQKFEEANGRAFSASVASGVAGSVFVPLYGLAYNMAQVVVLLYGVHLIGAGSMTVGLLIGFLLYVNSFYMPMRQLAAVWVSFQLALAALDRISSVLALESNLPVLRDPGSGIRDSKALDSTMLPASDVPMPAAGRDAVLAFDGVGFGYPGGREVLHDVSFSLERGKTYALVGPTGGGKTTTAALMARLYDPTRGQVLLGGRDIRTLSPAERAQRIGFILQEPFLFTGTIRENLLYGHPAHAGLDTHALLRLLDQHNLGELLARFEDALETRVTSTGEGISLGQKQLIAFMRAVLRDPELLVLDEATANVDTVTEVLLARILTRLPKTTTRVIIAHRLNTIADADEIFFINAGTITPAGSMTHALELLLHQRRDS